MKGRPDDEEQDEFWQRKDASALASQMPWRLESKCGVYSQ